MLQVLKDVEAVFNVEEDASVSGMANVRVVEAIFVQVSCHLCVHWAWIYDWLRMVLFGCATCPLLVRLVLVGVQHIVRLVAR